jgi:TetR/AcrR family transcriptional regulator, transcriptional repressor for nem operon
MRYDKGHKDATRQRIIDVASRQFRKQGVAAVGLAGIMTDAGLTNGAFYAHFGSKEDLVREVLSNPGRRNEMWQAATESGTGLASAIRGYPTIATTPVEAVRPPHWSPQLRGIPRPRVTRSRAR